jgi:23S rRNA (adenine-N6)-dimethyltransferase
VTGVRARRARPVGQRPRSQHFLRSAELAAELVRDACVSPDELVLEIGAGDGRLTAELRRRARRVLAVELDPALAATLRRRFGADACVVVVEADAMRVPLPTEPYRVVANLPFHATAAMLRRLLDDPRQPLVRADVIVEWGAARKRARTWPSTQLGVVWGAWFTFAAERRLPAACFAPRPAVDAGLVSIRRREPPLVRDGEADRYGAFVRAGFAAPTVRDGLRRWVSPRTFSRLADVHGFPRGAAGRDLDAYQWAALYRGANRPLAFGASRRALG